MLKYSNPCTNKYPYLGKIRYCVSFDFRLDARSSIQATLITQTTNIMLGYSDVAELQVTER